MELNSSGLSRDDNLSICSLVQGFSPFPFPYEYCTLH